MAKFVVETSARHLHLSQADLDVLFGEVGYQLHPKKDLSQPGQYACEERVTVVGPKGELKVTILGPVRPESQVELSLTDARAIGGFTGRTTVMPFEPVCGCHVGPGSVALFFWGERK